MEGKSIFLWPAQDVLRDSFSWNMDAMVEYLKWFDSVIIKYMNWYQNYNIAMDVPLFVNKLKDAGIRVGGYHYVYPVAIEKQYTKGSQLANKLGLDYVVLDAEAQWKDEDFSREATELAFNYKARIDVPLGLTSYRYPSYHREFPFKEFLNHCDFNMPQVYWLGANNPREQLIKTMGEFEDMMPGQPIIPIGVAYSEHHYPTPTKSQMDEFDEAVKEFGLKGISWWCFRQALWKRTNDEENMLMIDVINSHVPPASPRTSPPPEIIERIKRLAKRAYKRIKEYRREKQ